LINKTSIKELINLLIELNDKNKKEDKLVIRELFVGFVTPEWYYSDSYMLELNSINWKELDCCDFIKNWVKKFNVEKIKDYEDRFEKSFSSWYQPYHFFFENKWGIHIRSDAILRIAKKFYNYCPNMRENTSESVKASFLYVYFHHHYHNIIENCATIIELKYNNPNLYYKYYSNIYSKTLHSSVCLEELLANEYMVSKMIDVDIDKDFLFNELKHLQRSYPDYKDKTNYLLEEEVIKQICSESINSFKHDFDYNIKITSVQSNYQNEIPVWIHMTPKPLH
jgi:hypothetical protein